MASKTMPASAWPTTAMLYQKPCDKQHLLMTMTMTINQEVLLKLLEVSSTPLHFSFFSGSSNRLWGKCYSVAIRVFQKNWENILKSQITQRNLITPTITTSTIIRFSRYRSCIVENFQDWLPCTKWRWRKENDQLKNGTMTGCTPPCWYCNLGYLDLLSNSFTSVTSPTVFHCLDLTYQLPEAFLKDCNKPEVPGSFALPYPACLLCCNENVMFGA